MTDDEKKASLYAAQKRYREKNPEKVKATGKAWRDKNKEKIKEKNKITNRTRSKEQHSEYMKQWRKDNPLAAKSADLKKKYGITIHEYNEKLKLQNGVCMVCKKESGAKSLAVDHNHETGEIRDLLCHGCNTAIGLVGESKDILLSLIAYLDKWQSKL